MVTVKRGSKRESLSGISREKGTKKEREREKYFEREKRNEMKEI